MTFDPATADGAHALARLEREIVIWFASVTPGGQPQAFPVWFLWSGGEILVYSATTAKRNENVEADPKVSLHLNADDAGSDVVVIEGDALIDPDLPPASENAAYLAKYGDSIARLDMTPETFSRAYDVRIRVRPRRVRVYRD